MRRTTPDERRELLEFATLKALVAGAKNDAAKKDVESGDSDETYCPAFDLEFLEALDADAITLEKRRAFTRHLADCPRCAEQIALQIKHGGLFADKGENDGRDEQKTENGGEESLKFDAKPIANASVGTRRAARETDSAFVSTRDRRRASLTRGRKVPAEWIMIVAVAGLTLWGGYKITKYAGQETTSRVARIVDVPNSLESSESAFSHLGQNDRLFPSPDNSVVDAPSPSPDSSVADIPSPSPGSNVAGRAGSRSLGDLLKPTAERENFDGASSDRTPTASQEIDGGESGNHANDGDDASASREERFAEARQKIKKLRGGDATEFSASLVEFGYRVDGTRRSGAVPEFDEETVEKIVAAYDDAIKIAPYDADLRLELAWFLAENSNGSAEKLRRAAELFKTTSLNASEMELALGVCAFLKGADVEAQARFKKALEEDSTRETARVNLNVSVARASRANAETAIAKPATKEFPGRSTPAVGSAVSGSSAAPHIIIQ